MTGKGKSEKSSIIKDGKSFFIDTYTDKNKCYYHINKFVKTQKFKEEKEKIAWYNVIEENGEIKIKAELKKNE